MAIRVLYATEFDPNKELCVADLSKVMRKPIHMMLNKSITFISHMNILQWTLFLVYTANLIRCETALVTAHILSEEESNDGSIEGVREQVHKRVQILMI